MNRAKGLATAFGVAALMVIGVACGQQAESTTPTPDTPTVIPETHTPIVSEEDGDELVEVLVECAVQVQLALENPMLVTRGVEPIPSGFDAVNGAGCTFARPISAVTLDLVRDGNTIFKQVIHLDVPETIVTVPLSKTRAQSIPVDLELGSYDRLIKVTSVDGVVNEDLSDTNSVWLLDPLSSPKAEARKALIAARRALVDSLDIPYIGPTLVSFEPVEWRDASLGCPKPERVYAQVITPGFRLVFEYQGQQYEYHTNQDGSAIVECEEAQEKPTASDSSPIEFVMKENYTLGQDIEIKIRNNSASSYVYSEYYPACSNLEFYDEAQEARHLERLSKIVELPPGLFIIPEGTHCDIANESQIKPGEEVLLLIWSHQECIKDTWGCGESARVPVKAGKYTIVGKFPESKGSSGFYAFAEWSFTIGPSEQP